jgi:dipeptidyl-peptidase 4
VNAPDVNGPLLVGTRTTINGADLDHDFVRASQPETSSLLAVMTYLLPDIFLDLATGSDTTADVTLTAGDPPAALLTGGYARDTVVPALVQRLRDRGASVSRAPSDDPTICIGINYFAVRGRVAIRAASNPRRSFHDRIAAEALVIRETLALAAARRDQLLAVTGGADTTVEMWGTEPDSAPPIPLQPGVFTRLPSAYVLPPSDSVPVHLLRRHGILASRLLQPQEARIVERFVSDSVRGDHWVRAIADTTLDATSYVVPMAQRAGILAMMLLEPRSADGFVAAHALDSALPGAAYPVIRLVY